MMNDILDCIDTADLIEELETRVGEISFGRGNFTIKDAIEMHTGNIIQALSDEEVCQVVLKSLGRI